MIITSATFVKGIRGTDEILEDGVPQIAFVGRSNVGKSSVINALVGKKDLVKVGKRPGKTREINFFMINRSQLYFVDLPGYGYARASREEREGIRKLILWYLSHSRAVPQMVVMVVDATVGLTEHDKEMLEILRDMDHRFVVIANKSDKLKPKELARQLDAIREDCGQDDVIAYSTITKPGTVALVEKIFKIV